MDWLQNLDFEKVANAIVILVIGLAGGLGLKRGVAREDAPPAPAPTSSGLKMEGAAIVSSESVLMLARAVEAQNFAKVEDRAVARERTNALCEIADELRELRNEMARKRA